MRVKLFGEKVAFIGCHTDDELACAGLLRRLVSEGSQVHVTTVTTAATIHDRKGTEVSAGILLPEWNRSLDLIGVQSRYFMGLLPSNDLHPFRQDICQYIFDFCEKWKPDVLVSLDPDDENPAHSVVGIEAERVTRGRVPTHIRCQYPWNFSHGRPNLYVTLGEKELEVKRQVMGAYKSQEFRYKYADIMHHMAIADGLSVKAEAAEKFEIIRMVL